VAQIPYNLFGGWRGNVEADLRHRFSDLRSGSVSPRHPSSLIAKQKGLPTYKERRLAAIPDARTAPPNKKKADNFAGLNISHWERDHISLVISW